MKKILVSLMLAAGLCAAAYSEIIPAAAGAAKEGFSWRQEPLNGAFEVGEELKFSVDWKFITVGHATIGIDGIQEVGGRKAYHILTSARSTAFFDSFYRVRDTNETWIDTESLCTLKYSSINDENNKKKTETILFDQLNHTFTIVESSKTGAIPAWVQDVLSSLFYLRTKELTVGKDVILDAHSGDLSWPLRVKVLRKEKIKVPAGTFECFVVEPGLREDAGIFQQKGKLLVWMTADSRKIPVLMSSKIVVGSVEAKLTSMKTK